MSKTFCTHSVYKVRLILPIWRITFSILAHCSKTLSRVDGTWHHLEDRNNTSMCYVYGVTQWFEWWSRRTMHGLRIFAPVTSLLWVFTARLKKESQDIELAISRSTVIWIKLIPLMMFLPARNFAWIYGTLQLILPYWKTSWFPLNKIYTENLTKSAEKSYFADEDTVFQYETL